MTIFLRMFVVYLVSAIFFGCGDSTSSNSPSQSTQTTKNLTEYQFTATIDLKGGNPPFPVTIGDTVTGTFSFDATVTDSAILPTQGAYIQKSPAGVQIDINSISLNSDLSNWIGFTIYTEDNDSSVSPTRDIFWWDVNDTALATTFGLDYIQADFSLTDFTAKIFSDDTMPSNIMLSDYSRGNLFISGMKGNVLTFNLRSQITSITKIK